MRVVLGLRPRLNRSILTKRDAPTKRITVIPDHQKAQIGNLSGFPYNLLHIIF